VLARLALPKVVGGHGAHAHEVDGFQEVVDAVAHAELGTAEAQLPEVPDGGDSGGGGGCGGVAVVVVVVVVVVVATAAVMVAAVVTLS
jgi:hypothetical protein